MVHLHFGGGVWYLIWKRQNDTQEQLERSCGPLTLLSRPAWSTMGSLRASPQPVQCTLATTVCEQTLLLPTRHFLLVNFAPFLTYPPSIHSIYPSDLLTGLPPRTTQRDPFVRYHGLQCQCSPYSYFRCTYPLALISWLARKALSNIAQLAH